MENSKKSLEYPNACKAEEKAPSEPEWPSLIGKTSTKEGIEEKSGEFVHIFTTTRTER